MSDSSREQTPAYLWFDTEYTCLDLHQAELLQVALVITDPSLRRKGSVEDDVNLYVRLSEDRAPSPWVEENLPELVVRCRSDEAVDPAEADAVLAERVDRLVGPPAEDVARRPVLAGNSVQADWVLARRHLPSFAQRLHYRLLDVTALKIQWTDWFRGEEFDKDRPDLVQAHLPEPCASLEGKPHDAYYDVLASLAELKFYREKLFVNRDAVAPEERI